MNFTKHFKDRLKGRESEVKQQTIKDTFNKMLKKYHERIIKSPDIGILLTDMSNNINVPFVVNELPDGSFELDTLTIMKKKGFKATSDTKKIFKV